MQNVKALTIVATCALILWGRSAAAAQSQLLDAASKGHDILLTNETPPHELSDLLTGASAVARVAIKSLEFREVPERPFIVTDYQVEVYDVLWSQRPEIRTGAEFLLQRDGGVLPIGSRLVRVDVAQFPMFAVGEEYILFVAPKKERGTFGLVGGPQGAFRIDERLIARQVVHVASEVPAERPSLDSSVEELRAKIAAALERLNMANPGGVRR